MDSDSLRDRIAAVLRGRVACDYHDSYESVADSVIAALELQPIQRTTMFPERRWVTPWELIDPMEADNVACH